jgi:hypothetical protein
MEKEIANKLKLHLQNRVRGKIIVRFYYDTISIFITNENITYSIFIENAHDIIMQGTPLKYIADRALKEYKTFVLKKFFI